MSKISWTGNTLTQRKEKSSRHNSHDHCLLGHKKSHNYWFLWKECNSKQCFLFTTSLVKFTLFINPRLKVTNYICNIAQRTSYFYLVCKLIWPLWSSHIFPQWGWLILFSPDHFPGQHKNGESPPSYLFLRTFRAGRTYFLSAPFIAAESQHHEGSHLIYGPFESTLLYQGFPVEH